MRGGMRGVCAGADRPGPRSSWAAPGLKNVCAGYAQTANEFEQRLPSHGLVGAAWVPRKKI